ncbi:LAMI_0G11364g1_1 [Lachancea mirantina]|uniref:LAMI_0G11364g1_1 n=1 Tax=Lachancea mirantina TaxID=1230905 RepID=A0A1G4KB69_9SACH|nr:LAMI_0G11364g1_1 [Lachancea mirantina]
MSKSRTSSQKWTLGLIFLAVVVVLWVLSSFLINIIFEDGSYRKPFLITYINTASFVFYLVPTCLVAVRNYWNTGHFNFHQQLQEEEEGPAEVSVLTSDEPAVATSPLIPKQSNDDLASATAKLSLPATIQLSAQFCILWFAANLVTNASLSYTSVSSQTILSSTSSFFTLLVGAFFHVEILSKIKLWGSVVSFIGIILVTKSDSDQVDSDLHSAVPYKFHNGISLDNTDALTILYGNILAIAGALFYGVYSTLLKWKIREESRINMKTFFGFVGLFTLVLLWPTVILLHYTGWEKFEMPPTSKVALIVIVNSFITFISDFCWAKAMLLTSPLTVTVGLSTTIPFAMLGDFLFKERPMSLLYMVGATLICGSFFIVNRDAEEAALQPSLEDDLSLSFVV